MSQVTPKMPTCPDGSEPLIYELDGVTYPSCLSTGIFYAPPLTGAALADVLWPEEWSIVPGS